MLRFKELRVGHRHIIGTIIYCVTDYDQNDNDGLNDYGLAVVKICTH